MNYETLVAGLCKSGAEIRRDLTPAKAHLWHMATGVSGEAGELLDAIKKHVVYGQAIDRAHVLEELGDLEFFMEGLRQGLGMSRIESIEANADKLGKRYKGHVYSDEGAAERADKEGGV